MEPDVISVDTLVSQTLTIGSRSITMLDLAHRQVSPIVELKLIGVFSNSAHGYDHVTLALEPYGTLLQAEFPRVGNSTIHEDALEVTLALNEKHLLPPRTLPLVSPASSNSRRPSAYATSPTPGASIVARPVTVARTAKWSHLLAATANRQPITLITALGSSLLFLHLLPAHQSRARPSPRPLMALPYQRPCYSRQSMYTLSFPIFIHFLNNFYIFPLFFFLSFLCFSPVHACI
ncbi:hypothetical protein V1525DRAFT_273677 [Lipomyces kononenkoae]|uniref:Uncharacterized protein n=1 Tax=Lipomyces kononenkoae TaxID=34357 RepID=A0ACC3SVB3_LIPKO